MDEKEKINWWTVEKKLFFSVLDEQLTPHNSL